MQRELERDVAMLKEALKQMKKSPNMAAIPQYRQKYAEYMVRVHCSLYFLRVWKDEIECDYYFILWFFSWCVWYPVILCLPLQEKLAELNSVTEKRNQQQAQYDDFRKKRLEEFMAGFSIISMKLKEMYQMITLVRATAMSLHARCSVHLASRPM